MYIHTIQYKYKYKYQYNTIQCNTIQYKECGWLSALGSGPYLKGRLLGFKASVPERLCARSRSHNKHKTTLCSLTRYLNMIDIALDAWVCVCACSKNLKAAPPCGCKWIKPNRWLSRRSVKLVLTFTLRFGLTRVFCFMATFPVAKPCQWGCIKLLPQAMTKIHTCCILI